MPTTATATLTEFLLARIAEDEAAARAATGGPWWAEGVWYHDSEPFGDPAAWPAVGRGSTGADVIGHTARQDGADAAHIARHDPARVLAECEAKRQVVHEWATFKAAADRAAETEALPAVLTGAGIVTGMGRAVAHLAAAYSDHPDYRHEWKP